MTDARWPAQTDFIGAGVARAALALRLREPAERRRLTLAAAPLRGLDRLDDAALLRQLAWQVQSGQLALDSGWSRPPRTGPSAAPAAAAAQESPPEPLAEPAPPTTRAVPQAPPPLPGAPPPAADGLDALAASQPEAVARALEQGAASGADEVELDSGG